MDDIPLDDAPASAAPNPFDAFDVFAAPGSSSGLALPPPLAVGAAAPSTASVALGSPLISFSPVAASAPAASAATSHSSATAVDDLLSFSPIAAAPSSSASAASSSFMLMDELFLGSAPSSDATRDAFELNASASFASSSSSSSSSTSFPFPPTTTTVPPPAPLSDELFAPAQDTDAAATVRGSFSEFGAAPSSYDAFTDYEAPQSAPAAFHDGVTELYQDTPQDAVALSGSVSEAAEPTTEATIWTGSTETMEAHILVEEVPLESPRPEPASVADVTEAAELPREEATPVVDAQAVKAIVVADHTSDETAVECVVSDTDLQVSPLQSVADIPATTVRETEQHVESVVIVSSDETTHELHHAGDHVSHGSLSQSVSHPIEVDATSHVEIVAAKTASSYDHVEIHEQDTIRIEQHIVETQHDKAFPPTCEGAEGGTKPDFVDVVQDSGPSTFPSDIISPSSDTHDVEGFRALSGELDHSEDDEEEAEPAFDAEAVALYAEVTDSDDATFGANTDAPESVLHLHVREFESLQASVTEQDVSSPASVVSSAGSSVAGSAFSFIAAGGASAFAFGQPAHSPSGEDDVSGDYEDSSSQPSDGECDSPEISIPVPAADNGTSGSDASDPEIASSWSFESPGPNAGALCASVDNAADEFAVISTPDNDSTRAINGAASEASSSGFGVAEATKALEFQSFQESSPVVAGDEFGGFTQTSAFEENDGFGGFDQVKNTQGDGFGGFGQPANTEEKDDGFGGFGQSTISKESDDGFGGFGQSNSADVEDEDDDFGDFGSGATWGSAGFESVASTKQDDDFDDFTPAPAAQQWGASTATQQSSAPSGSSSDWGTPVETQPPPIAAPTDLNDFFSSAFPACKVPVANSLLPKPSTFHGGSAASISTSSIVEQASALHKSFHASLQDYRSMLAGDNDDPHQQPQQPSFESEALRVKYLKYVLTEKMSEASRHDGVFPQGSEKYQMFEAIAESGHEKNMREALAQLQEALFQSSMNEAVMRIARQAALSAKARIAEQAAQQQAHARGSLLATTRHFLSRSAGSSNDKDQSHSSSRTGSGSLGVLTPTSASVQKMSRFPGSQNGQDGESGHSSGYGSGEDTGSDVSVGEVSTHSEGEGLGGGSGPPSSSSSSARSGGLMKKFHERFTSLSSTKNRPRTVNLRRMGQSSEEVCKMELNMESINGGFDEVKWRCAGFLYETDEVARVAPSQIKIYSYPSNQLLTGKTDRSALSKFFKPGTTWSIDIGVTTE